MKQNAEGHFLVTPIYQAASVEAITGDNGALYFAVLTGGSGGHGAIIELTPPAKGQTAWNATTIYNFMGGNDGALPVGLTMSGANAVFGQTVAGGGSFNCGSDNGVPTGCGTTFELMHSKSGWTESLVHIWTGGNKGALPFEAPSFDAAGDLFISTQQGGGNGGTSVTPGGRAACSGGGVQGELPAVGKHFGAFVDLYKENCKSAKNPQYPNDVIYPVTLSQAAKTTDAANAALITSSGGGNSSLCAALVNSGCGTVGILTAGTNPKTYWTYRALHNFSGTDGALPIGYLLADASGSTIYGVAQYGGINCAAGSGNGCGVIYSLSLKASSWVWNGVVYKFKGKGDGATPAPQLTLFNGLIFGTTNSDGSGGGGTIFELEP
jgi:hypothetical protein